MNKEFIPYEQALELKELGFDEPCLGYHQYSIDGKYPAEFYYHKPQVDCPWNPLCINSLHPVERETNAPKVSAPLYQQCFRWFREKYNWHHSIEATADQHTHKLGYNYWIWNYKTGQEHYTMPKNRPVGDYEYTTYEEAELECLKKLIEIVKNK